MPLKSFHSCVEIYEFLPISTPVVKVEFEGVENFLLFKKKKKVLRENECAHLKFFLYLISGYES